MKKIILLVISFIFLSLLYINKTKEASKLNFDLTQIKAYHQIKKYYKYDNQLFMSIRSFQYKETHYFLILNLDTLKTNILSSKTIKNYKNISQPTRTTTYNKLLKTALKNTNSLSNAGVTEAFTREKGIYLTIDMCPSKKHGFEKGLFKRLINSKKEGKTPISIAITYKWAINHQKEFSWLLKQKEHIDITWINHSKTHYYNPKIKMLKKNFMLHDSTELRSEIFDVEKMLILNNQIPSLFFRFPGLISDKNLVQQVIENYSLIPLGTNNWLVKSQKEFKLNQIVLVHGNLNEREGISLFNQYYDNKIKLLPLLGAFTEQKKALQLID